MAVGCPLKACLLTSPKSTQKYLQRDQRPLDLHTPELKQTSLPRTLLNSCYYILKKKKNKVTIYLTIQLKNKTKQIVPERVPTGTRILLSNLGK